jgi:hypothetical protein
MTLAEQIFEKVRNLPPPAQGEVLDFVVFLDTKAHEEEHRDISLALAMRGMENDPAMEFTLKDVKESYR